MATTHDCAAQHFGYWMIEPKWFSGAVHAVECGRWQAARRSDAEPEPIGMVTQDGIGIIEIAGHMTKRASSFGGTSTIQVRSTVRAMTYDPDVRAIMAHIDSPGGTAAGTAELADDFYEARKHKLVWTHASDLMASAGAFVGLQAHRVSVNRSGEVGSLGTVAGLVDTSGAMEAKGMKVHVVSTGPYKGAFAQGAPVTDEQLDYLQELVESMNEPFVEAVKRGRGMGIAQARDLFFGAEGGKVWNAKRAQELGLVDVVQSFDAAMSDLRKELAKRDKAAKQTRAAQNRRMALLEE